MTEHMPGNVVKIRPLINRPGTLIQRAAEAGSETKRIIEPDPHAINGAHREIVINGLRMIAAGDFGKDYHGITRFEAEQTLHQFEWPLEAAEQQA